MNFRPSGVMLVEDVDCPDCKGTGYADGYVPTFEQKPYRFCSTCQGVKVRHRMVTLEEADMGPRPSREYSIERKNNDRGYCPSNCCWATRSQQAKNRRSRKR